jgi:hypothetical protein
LQVRDARMGKVKLTAQALALLAVSEPKVGLHVDPFQGQYSLRFRTVVTDRSHSVIQNNLVAGSLGTNV